MSILSDMPKSDVLVIGAAGLDVVGRLQGEFHKSTSNPAYIRTSFGGVARNVAENLARLGQPVRLLSVVGKDHIGEDVINYTRQAGVDLSDVYRTDKFPTGFYMSALDEHGVRQFAFDDMRILEELNDSYLSYNEDLFEKVGMVFMDANLSDVTLDLAFKLAHKYKLPVCADPTSVSLAKRLKPHLRNIRLMTLSSLEAGVLTGQDFDASDREAALEAARVLVNQGVGVVFESLAEYGLCYATPETSGHIPAIGTPIVDPTGAGDALAATVIYALMNDIDVDDAARLGVSAATLTLRHEGTVFPDLSLERLYDELAL